MRYKFILRNENKYPAEKMCKYMKVSKNAYYHWIKRKDLISAVTSKTHLKERIKVVFYESREIYGSCRIQQMLKREGLIYSRSYVGLLMNRNGFKEYIKKEIRDNNRLKTSISYIK